MDWATRSFTRKTIKKKDGLRPVYHPVAPQQKLKNPLPDVPPFWLPQTKIQFSTTPRHPSHHRHPASLSTDGLPPPPPASLPKFNYWLPDVPSYIPVDSPTNPIIHWSDLQISLGVLELPFGFLTPRLPPQTHPRPNFSHFFQVFRPRKLRGSSNQWWGWLLLLTISWMQKPTTAEVQPCSGASSLPRKRFRPCFPGRNSRKMLQAVRCTLISTVLSDTFQDGSFRLQLCLLGGWFSRGSYSVLFFNPCFQ